MKKLLLTMLIIFLLALVGCTKDKEITQEPNTSEQNIEENNPMLIVDSLGREVELDEAINRVVAIGPGALRLFTYVGNVDYLVGIEEIDKKISVGKPYVIANPSFESKDIIGPGGPNNLPDEEKLVTVQPQVIFSTYPSDRATADTLQAKTGIPVITLSYGKTGIFDEELYYSLEIIGKVVKKEERSREVIEYIKAIEKELKEATAHIEEKEKPSVYVGGLGSKGAQGIESTRGKYPLFEALNIINVADKAGKEGSFFIDKEKLIEWNPDKIIIDQGGLEKVKEDMQKNKDFYNALKAFQNKEVYTIMPYNSYTTNIDTALADAYYIGEVVYGEKFIDIDPTKKADEIYSFFLGEKLYDKMVESYGGFKPLE